MEPRLSTVTNAELLEAVVNRKPGHRSAFPTLLVLLVSAVFFLATGILRWNLRSAVELLVIIFVHECGHLLAMRMFRYKNLQMLFIPLLGGMARGEPDELNSVKIAFIALAGPAVGLLICYPALLAGILTRNPLFFDFASVSAIVNGVNLLPIYPLDGGVFVNEMLWARHPGAELGFRIVAAIVLGAAALFLHVAPVFLGGLAFFLVVTSRASFNLGLVVRRLRAEPGIRGAELSEPIVARIREEVRGVNPYFETRANGRGLPVIVASVWARIHKTLASPATIAGMLALYLVVLVVAAPVTFGVSYLGRKQVQLRKDLSPGVHAHAMASSRFRTESGAVRTLIVQVAPDYPAALRREGVQGVVTVRQTVLPTGEVTQVTATDSPDPRLSALATTAVRQWHYSRAPKSEATPITLEVPITFTLDRNSHFQDLWVSPR